MVTTTGGKIVGAFGTFVNIFATVNYVSNGEYGEGAFTPAQVAHSLGGLTEINGVVYKSSEYYSRKIWIRKISAGII